jgi:sterol desaturase/sphingolipid hydroxylase (fatty acid hydroxylase superfamily)
MTTTDLLFAKVLDRLAAIHRDLADPGSRIGWASLLGGAVLALVAYHRIAPAKSFRLRSFLAYLLPKKIYGHGSALLDLKLYLFNAIVRPADLVVFGLSVGACAHGVSAVLEEHFGARHALLVPGPWAEILLGLMLFAAYDFASYLVHRASHEAPLLWAFHRVHHSAEVLTPLTVLRKHPVYDALSLLGDVLVVGPVVGAVTYLSGAHASARALAISAVGFRLFSYAGSTLRHSHVWLSFGDFGNRLLVSPAMHQLHHSTAERHWNKNYGEVLAIWDVAFATGIFPRGTEDLTFGLGEGQAQPHPTLLRVLAEPFGYAWTRMASALRRYREANA